MPELIQENEINVGRIEALLKAASMSCSQENGYVRIDDGGMKIFIRVDASKKLLTLGSVWELKQSVPLEKKLAWVNEMNRKLIMVRFHVVRPETLFCDYQLQYEGGLSSVQLVSTVRLFGEICRGARQTDRDKIMGHD